MPQPREPPFELKRCTRFSVPQPEKPVHVRNLPPVPQPEFDLHSYLVTNSSPHLICERLSVYFLENRNTPNYFLVVSTAVDSTKKWADPHLDAAAPGAGLHLF